MHLRQECIKLLWEKAVHRQLRTVWVTTQSYSGLRHLPEWRKFSAKTVTALSKPGWFITCADSNCHPGRLLSDIFSTFEKPKFIGFMFLFDTYLITFRPVAHLDLKSLFPPWSLVQACVTIDFGSIKICDICMMQGVTKPLQYVSNNQWTS